MLFDESKKNAEPLFTGSNTSAKRRAQAWLDANLRRGEKEVFGVVGKLSPELAELLLARNPDNRAQKAAMIRGMSTDLRSANVELNGETIIISKCGLLNDGQNRCHAVVEAGVGYDTFFVFGVERATRLSVDQGTARTSGDFLQMEGNANGNVRAAIAGYLLQIERFGEIPAAAHAPGVRPTKTEVRLANARFADEIDAAQAAVPKKGAGRIGSYSLACVSYILIARRAGHIAAEDFMRQLIGGANLSEGHPVLLGRNRLLDEKRARALWPAKTVEIMLRAWNMTRRRKRSSKVQLMGAWPEIES